MKKKTLLICLIASIGFIANAQDVNSLCCEGAEYSEKTIGMEDALKNPEAVIVLDLSLQDPKLTSITEQISIFSNVKFLDVSYNRIGSIHSSFKNLQNIQCLDLSGNLYLQKLPDFLKEMPNLKVIKLEDLNWSSSKQQQTEQQFPNIQFMW